MKDRTGILIAVVLTVAAIGQIVLTFVRYNQEGVEWVTNVGWIILAVSAVFGWLPIYVLRKKGGVAKGKSYVQTTELVESGIYGIVRHPQYLAGILMSLAMTLIAQDWLVAGLGAVVAITSYISGVYEEASLIEKFGTAYQQYMERVPRMNFVLGIIRHARSATLGEQ